MDVCKPLLISPFCKKVISWNQFLWMNEQIKCACVLQHVFEISRWIESNVAVWLFQVDQETSDPKLISFTILPTTVRELNEDYGCRSSREEKAM